ncbi:acetyl-CoA carboxylase carboxyltransferase subunit alpha [Gottschalkiaceae bacterium SANA]|nr:acetyl-CoA carboxylase carboxyltransferase subunit alpha [Gottschalkiaceae bacterium SANA]
MREKMKRLEGELKRLEALQADGIDVSEAINKRKEELQAIKVDMPVEAWDRVTKARDAKRPVASHYIKGLVDDFMEFHGDRRYGDDPALIGGIGWIGQTAFTILGQEKGIGTKDRVKRNFGMLNPEGYRKAQRLMKQAEKFNRPILCLVDTPGAFCGLGAEERGQGQAIAESLTIMAGLTVPVITIVIGEGGSGGALAMAVADEVWMMENSIYSVLSPEGFASILWKDASRAQEASEVMKITAQNLESFGMVDRVVKEPVEFSTETLPAVVELLRKEILETIASYQALPVETLLKKRYERFRVMGKVSEKEVLE